VAQCVYDSGRDKGLAEGRTVHRSSKHFHSTVAFFLFLYVMMWGRWRSVRMILEEMGSIREGEGYGVGAPDCARGLLHRRGLARSGGVPLHSQGTYAPFIGYSTVYCIL